MTRLIPRSNNISFNSNSPIKIMNRKLRTIGKNWKVTKIKLKNWLNKYKNWNLSDKIILNKMCYMIISHWIKLKLLLFIRNSLVQDKTMSFRIPFLTGRCLQLKTENHQWAFQIMNYHEKIHKKQNARPAQQKISQTLSSSIVNH